MTIAVVLLALLFTWLFFMTMSWLATICSRSVTDRGTNWRGNLLACWLGAGVFWDTYEAQQRREYEEELRISRERQLMNPPKPSEPFAMSTHDYFSGS